MNKEQLKKDNIKNYYKNKIKNKIIITNYHNEIKDNIIKKIFNNVSKRICKKLKCINKKMILVKESYTSKCDALALESIKYHEHYLGNRKKRGLFESSTQKLINADLNGAINIMRKYVNLNYINQTNICNPTVIKIYDTKL